MPLIVADLLKPETAYQLLAVCDALVPLANHPDARSHRAQDVFNEDVMMNMNTFQAAAELGVKKIVFSSCVQVLSGSPNGRPPYLPFDSALPARPANPYALSKQVSEAIPSYHARRAPMDCVAIRFPWIVEDRHLAHLRCPRGDPTSHEGFSFLHYDDGAALINAVLGASLPGFRIYFAAARCCRGAQPVSELIRQYYPEVPWRRPLPEMTPLVDISIITKETGWVPQTRIVSVRFKSDIQRTRCC